LGLNTEGYKSVPLTEVAPCSAGSRTNPDPTRITTMPDAKGTDAQQYRAQGCSGKVGQKHMYVIPIPILRHRFLR